MIFAFQLTKSLHLKLETLFNIEPSVCLFDMSASFYVASLSIVNVLRQEGGWMKEEDAQPGSELEQFRESVELAERQLSQEEWLDLINLIEQTIKSASSD